MPLVGRTLAVDLGARRTGLAVCDALGIAIRTLPPVVTADADERLRGVLAAAAAEDAQRLLVGLPLNMDGSEGPAAMEARGFAAAIGAGSRPFEVALWDERLTTVEAADLLAEAGVRRDRQRGRIDSAAAAVLLRSWIDAQSTARAAESAARGEIAEESGDDARTSESAPGSRGAGRPPRRDRRRPQR